MLGVIIKPVQVKPSLKFCPSTSIINFSYGNLHARVALSLDALAKPVQKCPRTLMDQDGLTGCETHDLI